MRSFTLECIDSLHADQWQDIHTNSSEFYMMPLKPQARRVPRHEVPVLLLEENQRIDTAIQNTVTSPELIQPADELITSNGASEESESPASVMFRQTPSLEQPLMVKPAPINHSTLIRNFSGLFVQNVIKGLRGSPLAVIPMDFDSDNTSALLSPSLLPTAK